MDVYEINGLIEWLEGLKNNNRLSWVCEQEIREKLEEMKTIPREGKWETWMAVRQLAKSTRGQREKHGHLSSPGDYERMLKISPSTCKRWRDAGIIASSNVRVLTRHLVDIDRQGRGKGQFLKELQDAMNHGYSMLNKSTERVSVRGNNCRKFLGITEEKFKEWRKKYIINHTRLKDVVKDLEEYIGFNGKF